MRKLITLAFILTYLVNFAQTGQKNFIDQNYIEVTGKAEMEIVPDEIYLEITINEKDFKGKQSLESLETSMIEKLRGIGLDVSKDLVIKDAASYFKNYWIKNKTIKTAKVYQLLVVNAATAGLVFQELESIGISSINIDRVDHSEIQRYKTEVKIKAMQAAKTKATSLANAIDQTIGKAIFIREIENYSPTGRLTGLSNIVVTQYGINKEKDGKGVTIEFEKIKLEYLILTRFELN